MMRLLMVLQVAEQQSVPKMEQLFQIGTLLPCYVMAVRDTKVVSLSINPRLVNANLSASDVKADMVGHITCSTIHTTHTHTHTVPLCVTVPGLYVSFNTLCFASSCVFFAPLIHMPPSLQSFLVSSLLLPFSSPPLLLFSSLPFSPSHPLPFSSSHPSPSPLLIPSPSPLLIPPLLIPSPSPLLIPPLLPFSSPPLLLFSSLPFSPSHPLPFSSPPLLPFSSPSLLIPSLFILIPFSSPPLLIPSPSHPLPFSFPPLLIPSPSHPLPFSSPPLLILIPFSSPPLLIPIPFSSPSPSHPHPLLIPIPFSSPSPSHPHPLLIPIPFSSPSPSHPIPFSSPSPSHPHPLLIPIPFSSPSPSHPLLFSSPSPSHPPPLSFSPSRPPPSFLPWQVIPGWIKSVEDHGYIVDFGVAGKDGFLLKKNAEEFVETYNKGKPLSRGQVVQCLILGGADARSVPVTINPSRVRPAILPATTTVILQSLLPGVLVNITLQEVRL